MGRVERSGDLLEHLHRALGTENALLQLALQ